MQLYELEKRLTMNVKYLAKEHNIDMTKLYVNVQTSKGAFGHYSPNRWIMGEKKEQVDELALNPEFFQNPLEVVDTILHELVHVYCKQNGIKDTSRNGYYHNQKFKKIAEEFGLSCIATDSGWNTSPEGNESNLESINSRLPYPVTSDMIRKGDSKRRAPSTPRRKPHEYTCDSCNTTVKHKEIHVFYCVECKRLMAISPEDAEAKTWIDLATEAMKHEEKTVSHN